MQSGRTINVKQIQKLVMSLAPIQVQFLDRSALRPFQTLCGLGKGEHAGSDAAHGIGNRAT